ncbi:MAG: coproporphyrinogen III oxidase, partial [Chitinophagaceae bacterium]
MPSPEDRGSSPPGGGQGAKEQWVTYIHDLQNRICIALEDVDGKASFVEDVWERAEGGGGKTRVISNGNVFEKGGVNTSVVFGNVTDAMRSQLKYIPQSDEPLTWWACGSSVVIHPLNPFVPTVHCNYRMFEVYNSSPTGGGRYGTCWFGGGTDLTPYYLFEEDAMHFHLTYKKVCDGFDPTFYNEFKVLC